VGERGRVGDRATAAAEREYLEHAHPEVSMESLDVRLGEGLKNHMIHGLLQMTVSVVPVFGCRSLLSRSNRQSETLVILGLMHPVALPPAATHA
jgi:hypothetical protein